MTWKVLLALAIGANVWGDTDAGGVWGARGAAVVETVVASTETIAERCVADSTCTVDFVEPLNADDGCVTPSYDPSDTEAGTSPQFDYNDSGIDLCLVPVTGDAESPGVALAGRSYVSKWDGAGVATINGDDSGTGVKRSCLFHYEYLEGNVTTGDSPSCPSDYRLKMHQWTWPGEQFQIEGFPGSGCTENEFSANHSLDPEWDLFQATSAITIATAKTTWVRVESCVGTDATDLTVGDDVYGVLRVTRLDTGASETVTWGEDDEDPGQPGAGITEMHLNFYRQGATAQRYISTMGHLNYTTNAGQMPGPDCNIEPTAAECL